MSRIGKAPVQIPKGVKIAVEGATLRVEGPLGKLAHQVHPAVAVHVDPADGQLRSFAVGMIGYHGVFTA